MQGFGEDVARTLQQNRDERARVRNETTGRMVLDSPQNARWRDDYYRRVSDNRNETEEQIHRAIAAKNMGALNILGTKQVAEQLRMSQATAYLQMKSGIIPSFQVGRRLYTHDYILDTIRAKGRSLVAEGFADRTLPRMVYKNDMHQKW